MNERKMPTALTVSGYDLPLLLYYDQGLGLQHLKSS